ncbi:MAG: HAD family phosphatase, partial [Cyclobacteriaceae bacterium]|nr:HAD family phosphatase [Cyclobacteriaceae bacterium]
SDPENCLVIEDSGNGVTAAKSAGMFCIGYENSGTGKQNLAHADVLVKNLNEIDLVTIKSIQ